MPKIKSKTCFVSHFNRKNIVDSSLVEQKNKISYVEYNQNGNVILDETFDIHGNIETKIIRVFDDDNLLKEEHFFNGEEKQPFESKYFTYNNRILETCKIVYPDEESEEQYLTTDKGLLLEKTIVSSDGTSFLETKCEWENNKIIKITEYDEDNSIIRIKNYTYNENKQVIEICEEDKLWNDKQTETYSYQGDLMVEQKKYNLKDDLVSITKNIYNDKQQLIGKIVETQTEYFKYIYAYNDDGKLKRESTLNRNDLVLSDKEIEYDAQGEELQIKVFSRNIVDNIDEMILAEVVYNEIVYWE